MSLFSKLLEIGNEEASFWGGYCKTVEVNMGERVANFSCVEHSGEFITSMSFDEIKEKYGVAIETEEECGD